MQSWDGSGKMETIRIKYFSEDTQRLRYIDGKSDWIDLRASERVELKKGEYALIPLGVAMQLPEGFEGHLVPRSSTFKNYGFLTTNPCVFIDNRSCGDTDLWGLPVFATLFTLI